MTANTKGNSPPPSQEERHLKRYVWLLIATWTAVTLLSLSWNLYERHENTQEIALTEARTQFSRDLAFRSWVGSSGGIYAPVNDRTIPSRHLQEIPERDVVTPSGKQLTLINPEYMIRLVNSSFPELHGAPTRVTSLNPRRLLNAPDSWELQALKRFDQGKTEVYEFVTFNNIPHLRLMRPLFAESPCLHCHPDQPYKEGDLMGGMSIVLPMAKLLNISRSQTIVMVMGHSILWSLGMIGLFRGREQLLESIKKRIQAEKIIMEQATHDDLTGLPNRRLLLELLNHTHTQCIRHKYMGGLLFLDLDNFKPVNDTFGHDVGDTLLQEIARRLEDTLRKEDVAARLGGDEFVVLLSEINGTHAQVEEQTLTVAKKICLALAEPFVIQGHTLSISASIGATLFPQDGSEPEQLLKQADIAMYSAKKRGSDRVCFFKSDGPHNGSSLPL